MSDEAMQRLIDFISTASPVVWEAAMRRVYVVVIADLIWGAVFFGCAYGLYKYAKKNQDDWDDEMGRTMFYALIVVCALAGGLVTTSGLMWLGSPTYAAIKFLMNTP